MVFLLFDYETKKITSELMTVCFFLNRADTILHVKVLISRSVEQHKLLWSVSISSLMVSSEIPEKTRNSYLRCYLTASKGRFIGCLKSIFLLMNMPSRIVGFKKKTQSKLIGSRLAGRNDSNLLFEHLLDEPQKT